MNGKSLSRLVWRISLPVIFAEITESIVHVTDTIFLARVGVTELGAVAIADTILELFLVLPLALVDGIQILTARRAGERRPDEVATVFRSGFFLVLGVTVLLTAAVKWLGPYAVDGLVSSESVGIAVDEFIQIAAYGLLFTAGSFACSALLVSLGKTRLLIPATILLAITNVLLDYTLILGGFGGPRLGIRGAALGAVGAEAVTFLFLTYHVWRLLAPMGEGARRARFLDLRVARALGRLSAPVVAQGAFECLRWLVFFLILERMSASALAVGNLVYSCYVVFKIPTEGFAETACSMVSRFVGRERTERIDPLVGRAVGFALMVTLPLLALTLLFPGWVLAVFSPDPSLIADSSASLRVIALAMLVITPGEVWLAAVVGTGDTKAAFGIEVALSAIMLTTAYFATLHPSWTVAMVWLSLPIAWLVGLAASYAWMRSGVWRRLEI